MLFVKYMTKKEKSVILYFSCGVIYIFKISTIFKKENFAENICENVMCMTYDILMIRGYNYIIYLNLLMFFNEDPGANFLILPAPHLICNSVWNY